MLSQSMVSSGNRLSYVRHLFLTLTLAAVPAAAAAQAATWTIDPGHSAATFTVRHMVVANVKGEFTGPVKTDAPHGHHDAVFRLVGESLITDHSS